ncbi:MAG: hypothetical protein GY822_25540 [Deltaproteobacteria bacterium]|nr:hypothetical protein [Deltaproteobacteria bacterium]
MADYIKQISDDFWNIRGSFKVSGLLEIGTHSSLVKRKNGRFVLLDGYTFTGSLLQEIRDLTDGGEAIEAVLNLHPFHTVHVRNTHELFPKAKHYGTARHKKVATDVPWETPTTDDKELHEVFADELTFFVPRGVDFISKNEKVHFSSVLALHPSSRSLHVDDTLTFSKTPIVGGFNFHLTMAKALEKRAGAAGDFRRWAKELATACVDVDHLCAAHTGRYSPSAGEISVSKSILAALDGKEKILKAHERKYGA